MISIRDSRCGSRAAAATSTVDRGLARRPTGPVSSRWRARRAAASRPCSAHRGLDQPTAAHPRAGVEIRGCRKTRSRDSGGTTRLVLRLITCPDALRARKRRRCRSSSRGDSDALPRATALLAEVGLADRAHHYPFSSPAASSSGSRRAGRWRGVRRSSSPTSPRAISTRARASDHRAVVACATRSPAPSCSSTTASRWRPRADRVVTLRDGRVVSDEPTTAAPRDRRAGDPGRETRGAGRNSLLRGVRHRRRGRHRRRRHLRPEPGGHGGPLGPVADGRRRGDPREPIAVGGRGAHRRRSGPRRHCRHARARAGGHGAGGDGRRRPHPARRAQGGRARVSLLRSARRQSRSPAP